MTKTLAWTALAVSSLASGIWAAPAFAQVNSELVSQTEFRVCADPHDLPFSNDKGEGFENKIAQLIAQDWKVPVAYTYFPDSQGFVRATLLKFKCDVIMGTVTGMSDVSTTTPYYHTGYMMVTRESDHIKTTDIGNPSVAGKRFGLVGGTPPTDLLVAHNLMDQTTLYQLMVDTRVDQPARKMLEDLGARKIDVGLVWGPFAGFYIKQENLPLTSVFLAASGAPVRLDYHIAMGVRSSDVDFRRKLNATIGRHMAEITAILRNYQVPLLGMQNEPLTADAPNPG